jgi:uncharacterized protein YyaL (SSP411 family)
MSGNRLANETSPYLLQHAKNPVDWYPWGSEAFETAKLKDKPVFLSIGYSTCHWCHVMAHESFEDPEVARLMNETFVSIKVDREERPDIDRVYMTVAQLLTGRGGWPLSILMTPQKRPFYAATYIPKASRFGTIGMLDLVPRIGHLWAFRRGELLQTADRVVGSLGGSMQSAPGDGPGPEALAQAYGELKEVFDAQHGGFGTAPKFPSPYSIGFLLRYYTRSGDDTALEMAERTLDAMASGGLYDHLGGGFHRYSTDREWRVPHFEKMLYDQALLVIAYSEAYQATQKRKYAEVVRKTVEYLLRDMRDTGGGFYSAEDADSEGEEGRFYLWTKEEVRSVLDDREAKAFTAAFGITPEGNYRDEASGARTGRNILYRTAHFENPAGKTGGPDGDNTFIENARQKLFAARSSRLRPHRDEKILADWNGLAAASLAVAGRVFGEPEYTQASQEVVRFVLKNMRSRNGRLFHTYAEKEARIPAYADDYAFTIWGLLELYETTFETRYLEEAVTVSETFVTHFWDKESGGFFFTADDGEPLFIRTKEFYDSAVPSGNSVAMMNLLRLGRITGDTGYDERAMRLVRANSENIRKAPMAFLSLLLSVDFAHGPTIEVVIAGEKGEEDTKRMIDVLRGEFSPRKVVLLRDTGSMDSGIRDSGIDAIAPWSARMDLVEGCAAAYVCVDYSCRLPTIDPEVLRSALKRGGQ